MPEIVVDYRRFLKRSQRLEDLSTNMVNLSLRYQKLVAELVLLRLFSLLEDTLRSITVKVLCGATYLDGTSPNLFLQSSNARSAVVNMKCRGRRNPRRELKWTMVSAIKQNVQHLLDPADNLVQMLSIHSAQIEEMRRIRNHIAHNTPDTRKKYKSVVSQYYGAYVNCVTPGVLLLTSRFSPPIIQQYIIKCRIIIKDLVKD